MEWEEDVICGFVSFEPVLTVKCLPYAGFYSRCLYNDDLRGYELPWGEAVATKSEVQAVSCPCQTFLGSELILFGATLEDIRLSLFNDKCSHMTSSTERRSFQA